MPEEAVTAALENDLDGRLKPGDRIKVYAFRRAAIGLDADSILERVYENLDEEHGNPDGSDDPSNKPPPEVVAAAEALVAAILASYVPWACERAPGDDVEMVVPEVSE